MKARTFIELLTLSSNFYLIAKDKELLNRLGEMAEKGKNKINHLMEDLSDENEDGDQLLNKILTKAHEAKEELERKMEEIAVNIYQKMHIAHTNDIKELEEQIENLSKKLEAVEVRIKMLEDKNPIS